MKGDAYISISVTRNGETKKVAVLPRETIERIDIKKLLLEMLKK